MISILNPSDQCRRIGDSIKEEDELHRTANMNAIGQNPKSHKFNFIKMSGIRNIQHRRIHKQYLSIMMYEDPKDNDYLICYQCKSTKLHMC